jgi:two-component system response regulator YesN
MIKLNQEQIKVYAQMCNLVSSIVKLDVKLLDLDGNKIILMAKHQIPSGLANTEEENKSITELLKASKKNEYLHYINSGKLECIFAGIWKDDQYVGAVMVGPFLSDLPSELFISQIISSENLPISYRKQYQDFYETLSILSMEEIRSIGELLVNLCPHDYIASSQLVTANINNQSNSIKPLQHEEEDRKIIIEHRYKIEKRIIDAIARGDKEGAINHLTGLTDVHLKNRTPENPIRSAKNLTFVQNTLFRIAAEKGGVHPVYLHDISEKYAVLIERADNLPYLQKLIRTMLDAYCELVIEFSTRKFSSIVKNAVQYINFNLESSLTLTEIAEAIHVNPSHLSKKFKIETGKNMTDYINLKRIEAAKLYLSTGNMSITDIAYLVGYNDVNYFSRIFKRITSMTPSQYIKELEIPGD